MQVLVIGAGERVVVELASVDRGGFDVVIGVNQAAIMYRPVDIHMTLHPERFARRKIARMVSHRDYPGVDEVFDYAWRPGGRSGSSGLFAVKYALEKLQADSIVLAGIGMDGKHVYSSVQWPQADGFRKTWLEVAPRLRGRVHSLGGWTATLLNEV